MSRITAWISAGMGLALMIPALAAWAQGPAAGAPAAPTKEELAKYAKARAIIETRLGNMTVKFFPEKAPLHVKNFITLAEKGFYDGTIFHRVIPGFMIQGGDPSGNGSGGPGYTIKAEFNDVRHAKGILSMARRADPNSAGSQFFVMVADAPHLDGQYSAFGQVVEGIGAADKMVAQPRDRRDRPLEPVEMKVRIEYEK